MPTTTAERTTNPTTALLTAAWMAIALGIVMQVLTLIAGPSKTWSAATAELLGKVSWSTIVCIGLAVGMTAARSKPTVTGLAGLVAAPAAFLLARTLQKSLAQTLGVTGAGAAAGEVLFLTIAKAIQYGVFGVLIAHLNRRENSGLFAFLLVGLIIGGSMAAVVTLRLPAPTFPASLARVINETLFPAGCALILYASDSLGRRLAKV